MRIDFNTETIANNLYNAATDFDRSDYEETKETDIKQLEECLYHIQTIAENEYNSDYWRTLCEALRAVFDN